MVFPKSSLMPTLQNDMHVGDTRPGNWDAYLHEPLQFRQIRLFRVTRFSDEIFCEMKHFPLEDCPKYHALSYAWGPGLFSHRVFFENHKQHLITKHLHQALESIVPLLSPSWFWIDQVCINQHDSEDKAKQVALMAEIYTSAVQTIVWLGPAYEKSDLAMSYVEGLAELIRNYDFDARLVTLSPVELGFPHEDEQVWPAFQCLFRRPWWNRLWIIQEAIKAQDIVFVVGGHVASYADLLTLSSAHERLIQLIPQGTYKLGILSGLSKAFYCLRNDVLRNIGEFRSGKYASMDGQPSGSNIERFVGNVLTVLEFSRYQLCTEPVDRVYAILGLVGDQIRDKVKIDYSDGNKQQYWQTYLHFFRHTIKMFLDAGYVLTTLCTGQHTENTPKLLPSWCPELVRPLPTNRPCLVEAAAGNIPASASWKPDYTMIDPCGSNPSILHVTGVRVDSIKTLIRLWSAPRPVRFDRFTCGDATDAKIPLMQCFKLAESLRKSPVDFTWMDVFFRTLVMNTTAFSADPYPSDTIGTDCLAFLDCLTAIIDHHHNGKRLNTTDVSEGASRYASACLEYTRGRALFLTEGGRLGLCDAAAAAGDEVVIWFNCPFPAVQRLLPGKGGCSPLATNSTHDAADSDARTWLPGRFPGERREQQHRKLLGLCYVDGLMRGEIFSERDLGEEGYSNFLIV